MIRVGQVRLTESYIQKSLRLRLRGLKRSLANWFTSLFAPSERRG